MKLKERFRKAMFHFFKEEIMEFTAPEKPIPYVVHETKFKVLHLTAEINISEIERAGYKAYAENVANYLYEMQLQSMKDRWWHEIRPLIKTEIIPLVDPRHRNNRRIVFSMMVAGGKQ